jgi:hypothetical protein
MAPASVRALLAGQSRATEPPAGVTTRALPGAGSPFPAAGPPLPFGPEIRVNRSSAGVQGNPQVGVFPDGGFVVVWTAAPGGNLATTCGFSGGTQASLRARVFGPDGAPAGGVFQPVRPFGTQLADSVAALADGSFVVVYDQVNDQGRGIVMAARLARDGTSLVPPFRVHAASRFGRGCGQVGVHPDGSGFAVAWSASVFDGPGNSFGHLDAYARRFTAAGAPLGPEFLVARGFTEGGGQDEQPGAVAVGGDGSVWVAIWDLGDDLTASARQFDAAGQPRLALVPNQRPPQADPTLSVAGDGSLALAWSHGFCGIPFAVPVEVWAQRLSAAGDPLDSNPLQVNRRGACETQPRVVAFRGGGFVALWTDRSGRDGSGAGVFGRVFGADGTPQTRDFRVNVTTDGDQVLTGLAANASGQVVAVWQQSANPAQIVARRLVPPGG